VHKYRVKKSHSFNRDIDNVISFLTVAEYEPDSIKAILEGFYQDMSRLRDTPYIGAKLANKTSIPNEYRYLLSGQYLIFYKVYENEKIVRIFHVYHSREPYLVKLGLNDIEFDDIDI
jgi:plasmid stabilization system protein ParE